MQLPFTYNDGKVQPGDRGWYNARTTAETDISSRGHGGLSALGHRLVPKENILGRKRERERELNERSIRKTGKKVEETLKERRGIEKARM